MTHANAAEINPETLRALAGLLQATKAKNMDDLLLDMAAVYHDIFELGIGGSLTTRELSLEIIGLYALAMQVAGRGNYLCEAQMEIRPDADGKPTDYITGVGQSYTLGSLKPLAERARRIKAMMASAANAQPVPAP